jgi:hypothetical protein
MVFCSEVFATNFQLQHAMQMLFTLSMAKLAWCVFGGVATAMQ